MQTPNELLPDGLQMDLLWKNASPTSGFALQTISLDLSKYKAVVISTIATTTNVNYYDNFLYIDGRYKRLTVPDDTLLFRVGVIASEIGVSFGHGYRNSSEDDTCCIPSYIYGVR